MYSVWDKICLHGDLISAHRTRKETAMNKGMRVGYARVSTSGQKLEDKKVDLMVLDQGIDTTSIYGCLQFDILAAIGEFERGIIKERSYEGRQRAAARQKLQNISYNVSNKCRYIGKARRKLRAGFLRFKNGELLEID